MSTITEVLAGVLADHVEDAINSRERWTRCECGAVVPWLGSEDESWWSDSWRAHLATALTASLREYVQQAETVERAARALMAAVDYEEGEYDLLESDALADLNQGTARALAAFTEAAS